VSEFVDSIKRDIELPPGCKGLIDAQPARRADGAKSRFSVMYRFLSLNRRLVYSLCLFACLAARAATNLPPAAALLLDQKEVFDLTAKLNQYEALSKLSGRLTCAGSGLVTLLIHRWASEFDAIYPDVDFDIQGGGSIASFPDFLDGKVDLMPMGRPLRPEEIKAIKTRFGSDPTQIVVAQDAVGVYVNKNNPLPGLTLAQLDAIYSRDPKRGGGRPEFWRDLGVTGSLAGESIGRVALNLAQSTHSFFRNEVMQGRDYRFDVSFEPVASSLVQAVGADDSDIGFASVMFATRRTRLVPLRAADGSYVMPNYENTVSGKYPLGRQMVIVFHRQRDGSMNPVAREFLRFAVSRRGQRITGLAETYPITVAQQQEALRLLGSPTRGE
jgi:phosphate transport system substrate-binding protein